jgi:RNase H
MEYLDERDLNVFIDGSSFSSPRRGGMGIVFITEAADGHWAEEPYELQGIAGATNNQMELQAGIEALQAITRGRAPVEAASYRKLVFWMKTMACTGPGAMVGKPANVATDERCDRSLSGCRHGRDDPFGELGGPPFRARTR